VGSKLELAAIACLTSVAWILQGISRYSSVVVEIPQRSKQSNVVYRCEIKDHKTGR
jgi:hypothetical protein